MFSRPEISSPEDDVSGYPSEARTTQTALSADHTISRSARSSLLAASINSRRSEPSLGRQERQDVLPIRDYEDRGLPPLEALLYDDPLPRGPELAGEGGHHGLLGLIMRTGHGYALPR